MRKTRKCMSISHSETVNFTTFSVSIGKASKKKPTKWDNKSKMFTNPWLALSHIPLVVGAK